MTDKDGLALIPITNKSIVEFYPTASIPAGTYAWQPAATATVAAKAVLVSFDFRRKDCDLVGKVAQTVSTRLTWLQQNGHPKWKAVDLNYPLRGWEQYDCVRKYLGKAAGPGLDDDSQATGAESGVRSHQGSTGRVTAQRLSRIAAGIAIVTVLGVTALVTRNVLWPDDPDASLQRNGGKVMGDMAGYVGRVDREARTVDISTSPLGIRPVVLLVTNETAIVVNGKQGAIGDLWKDLPVRVLYEVRDNARYATSIQVTAGDSLAASPAAKDPAPASATPTPTKEPQAPSVATSPAPATAPPPVAPAPVAPATPPKPPAPPAVATKPTPVAPAPVPVAPPRAVVTAPPAVVGARRPPAPVASPRHRSRRRRHRSRSPRHRSRSPRRRGLRSRRSRGSRSRRRRRRLRLNRRRLARPEGGPTRADRVGGRWLGRGRLAPQGSRSAIVRRDRVAR